MKKEINASSKNLILIDPPPELFTDSSLLKYTVL
jgi:hypothetical protein